MNVIAMFIRRPVGTLLVVAGIVLAGSMAFVRLPVAPLPSLEIPVVLVSAAMPGASPQTMATTVATPLERRLAQIADVTAVTSQTNTGQASVILQFGLGRDLDGAARDVQAAINASRADLPTALRANPVYRRFNPAGFPILLLSLSSATLTTGQLYDVANSVVSQKLAQIKGVGNVDIAGSSLPAVRVDLDPNALFHYGIGLEDVRAALASANANSPKGAIEQDGRHYQLYANDQARHAAAYRGLIVAYRNGAGVALSDVADVQDSVEDIRAIGLTNGRPAVLLLVFRETSANIVDTVARIRASLPALQAALPNDVQMVAGNDQSQTIRSALHDTEMTLLIAIVLVVLVVFAFLRNVRAALIPTVAVPVSIIGTFAAIYLCGYTLDNLSLMALTISTGFVVDDAIVVLENVSRHLEAGMSRRAAVLRGVREVVFTVVSISASLIAVFLPILLMQGIAGRLFREFGVTLVLSIIISLILSLTATPVMCALLLPDTAQQQASGRLARLSAAWFDAVQRFYARTLRDALRHRRLVLLSLAATIIANFVLFSIVPKGLFPEQDTDLLRGEIKADETASFASLRDKLSRVEAVLMADPAVKDVQGFSGGRFGGNAMSVYVTLKPKATRASDPVILARLRPKLAAIAGAQTVLQAQQDLPAGGGRAEAAAYQYTLQADTAEELATWVPRLVAQLKHSPALADVSSDDDAGGLAAHLVIDRDASARLGVTPQALDNTLYDAFGQRRVSTIFDVLNQYSVIMELAPRFLTDLSSLGRIYVSTSGQAASGTQTSNAAAGTVTGSAASDGAEQSSARNAATNAIATARSGSVSAGTAVSTALERMVPLNAIATLGLRATPTTVNRQSGFVATTISFNLNKGHSFADAEQAIDQAAQAIVMPASVHRDFAGNARELRDELGNQLLLVGAGLAAAYIVLGMLYESFMHPLTILSTLPSAGIGVVLALLISHTEFSVIALIAVFLLIGIVKKNAILMVDFALSAQREQNLTPAEAIYQACLIRFRPIVMTTASAILAALPLMLGRGDGAELRQPLGLSIVGGLMVSQVLTLYTTPVVYLYLDRLRLWSASRWRRRAGRRPGSDGGGLVRQP